MPPSQRNSSFIPKRNPTTKPKKPRVQRFYIFSLIATALFVASLLASVAVFVYERQVQFNLAEAITDFNTAAANFSEADYARVIEFSQRINTIQQLLNSHVSIVALLSILEQNTVGTAQITSLTIERSDRETVMASAAVLASTIDTTLFQRDQYLRTPELAATDITEITFATDAESSLATGVRTPVNLDIEFTFTADEILYSPTFTPQQFSEPVADTEIPDTGREEGADETNFDQL